MDKLKLAAVIGVMFTSGGNYMGRIVIVAYRPKPGREKELEDLTKTHVNNLRQEGLVTDREPIIMRAKDKTVVEVFEWKSEEAIESAHTNAAVLDMWQKYSELCEYVPVGKLDESLNMFSEFASIN